VYEYYNEIEVAPVTQIPPEDIVLLIIGSYNKGSVFGRTLLQKLVYLVSLKAKIDLDFHPYYYGPYSEKVAFAVSYLRTFGLVTENRVSNDYLDYGQAVENIAYRIEITDRGKRRFEELRKSNNDLAKGISGSTKEIADNVRDIPKIKSLSLAAKFFEVLKNEGRPMTNKEIGEAAKEIGWSFTGEELGLAQRILKNLNLVKTS
jgi:uncharacterized protein YwgA